MLFVVINGTKVLSTSSYFTDIRSSSSSSSLQSSSPLPLQLPIAQQTSAPISWIKNSYQGFLSLCSRSSSFPSPPSAAAAAAATTYIDHDIDSEHDEEKAGLLPPYY